MTPWTSGNEIKILISGEEYFPELFSEIEKAKSSIQIEMYILRMDKTGGEFIDRLAHAAKRGVRVRMLLDGFGSQSITNQELDAMRSRGIHVKLFRPFLWSHMFSYASRRLHRKVIVLDDNIAFVGGLNIADDYYLQHPTAGKSDVALKAIGPAAKVVSAHAKLLWLRLSNRWKEILNIRKQLLRQSFDARQISKRFERVRYRIRDGWFAPRSIEHAYRDAIRASNRSIMIAQAYFFPPLRLLHALRRAANRGVRVQLLLQGRADVKVIKWAEWMLYERLLKDGIQIFEFKEKHLHSKAAVVDGRWMTVGSSNLDPWSLRMNLEGNLIVENSPQCHILEQRLRELIERHSDRVSLERATSLTLWQRFLGNLGYFLLSLLP